MVQSRKRFPIAMAKSKVMRSSSELGIFSRVISNCDYVLTLLKVTYFFNTISFENKNYSSVEGASHQRRIQENEKQPQ